jgi:hypothetical protein
VRHCDALHDLCARISIAFARNLMFSLFSLSLVLFHAEVYVPLRSVVSKKVVNGWKQDDQEMLYKMQVSFYCAPVTAVFC